MINAWLSDWIVVTVLCFPCIHFGVKERWGASNLAKLNRARLASQEELHPISSRWPQNTTGLPCHNSIRKRLLPFRRAKWKGKGRTVKATSCLSPSPRATYLVSLCEFRCAVATIWLVLCLLFPSLDTACRLPQSQSSEPITGQQLA